MVILDRRDNIINKIKKSLSVGEEINITVNLGRNKYENIKGVINELHNNIFIIKTNNCIRSFSYADILTGIVMINS